MVSVRCYQGNILDVPADMLILSGNTSLHLTGGVGADLISRYPGTMQERLHAMVADRPQRIADRGEIFVDRSDDFGYMAIIHAVAVDAFYESSVEVIQEIILRTLDVSHTLGAETVAMSCLATGFGNLSLEEFCQGLKRALAADTTAFSGTIILTQIESYRFQELTGCLE